MAYILARGAGIIKTTTTTTTPTIILVCDDFDPFGSLQVPTTAPTPCKFESVSQCSFVGRK